MIVWQEEKQADQNHLLLKQELQRMVRGDIAVVENLKSKSLYKIELYLIKIIPMILSMVFLLNTILSYNDINSLYDNMHNGNAKAVTCSNENMHLSIVLFNNHTSTSDYLNSIVHEAEHIKQAMLNAYDVEDRGEPPAHTIGYLVGRMWEVFSGIIQ